MIIQHHLNRYNKFIRHIQNLGVRHLNYCESHHIIPRCMGGNDDPQNLIKLTFREHFLAHYMLYLAYPDNYKLANAFHFMCNVIAGVPERRREMRLEYGITSKTFQELKTKLSDLGNPSVRGVVNCIDLHNDTKTKITSFEFALNPTRYAFHTKGMISVINKNTLEQEYIHKDIYKNNKGTYMTSISANLPDHIWNVYDPITQQTQQMKYKDFVEANKSRHRKDKLVKVLTHKLSVVDEDGHKQIIKLEDFDRSKYKHRLTNKIKVWDLNDLQNKFICQEEYYFEPNRYLTSTKGKVLAFDTIEQKNVLIDKNEFDRKRFVGQTKNLTTVFDTIEQKYVQITRDQAKDKNRYKGPCSGKINVIDITTGRRGQIKKEEFNNDIHISLGNKQYYFKALFKPKQVIKNIHIYEWAHLDHSKYEIQDLDLFNRLQQTYLK